MSELFAVIQLLVIVPLAWLFWVRVSNRFPTEEEWQRLLDGDYELAGVTKMLQYEDVKSALWSDRKRRRKSFFSYSQRVVKDVVRFLRQERLSFGAVALVAVFFLSFGVLWLKAWIYCNYRDVFYISGLGVSIFRGVK